RPVELTRDARPEPMRLEERERNEARRSDDSERDGGIGRGSSPAAVPEVEGGERGQNAGAELCREAGAQQRPAEDGPLLDDSRQTAEREERRPQVIARAEE